MKKRLLPLCCAALLASGLVFTPPARAEPWRVALFAGGSYLNYQMALQGLAERLAELGLIADGAVPPPGNGANLASMWQWLSENAGGDRLRFVADAFYSPEWDPEKRAPVKRDLLERLRGRGDIDCLLVFGTWAGQDIAQEPLDVPVLVLSVTNAVEAGIIPSPEDSGRDNLMAIVYPDRYKNQVRIFHQLIGFSRLGIVYEDTPSGRSAVALGEIEAAAGEAGAELLRCTNAFDIQAAELTADWIRACHEDLVKQGADAVYLTYNRSLRVEYAADVLKPLIAAGLPTFAQQGSELVKLGALLSVSNANIKEEGVFAAEALEKIMKGDLPRSLPHRYESTVSLTVNLHTAALIGWNLPMEVLAAVDEFYRDF